MVEVSFSCTIAPLSKIDWSCHGIGNHAPNLPRHGHQDGRTRQARSELAAQNMISDFEPNEQDFIRFVLDQYVKEGEKELDLEKLPTLLEIKYKSVHDAIPLLAGQPERIRDVFVEFQQHLYAV